MPASSCSALFGVGLGHLVGDGREAASRFWPAGNLLRLRQRAGDVLRRHALEGQSSVCCFM